MLPRGREEQRRGEKGQGADYGRWGRGLPARAKASGADWAVLEEHRGGLCVWSRVGRGGQEGLGRLCRASWAWGRTWALPQGAGSPGGLWQRGYWPDLAAQWRLSHSGGQTVGGRKEWGTGAEGTVQVLVGGAEAQGWRQE